MLPPPCWFRVRSEEPGTSFTGVDDSAMPVPSRSFSRRNLLFATLCDVVLAASLLTLPGGAIAADDPPAAAAPAAAPDAAKTGRDASKPGGIEVQMPQSPQLTPVLIGYIREIADRPRPASRMDVEPDNAGSAGAKMAIDENNAGGRFTGDLYSLDTKTVASRDAAVEALQGFYENGHHFIIFDGPADTLLKLSDWAKGKDILLFNVRAMDVSLRQENCRANVMHVVPDRYMLADALAQYLVTKRWTNWLLVNGTTPGDLAYVEAIRRAAQRFGANIVDQREYQDISGGRRDDVGVIPPGTQASADNNFAAGPDYQVILVADEDQLFGPYMPYRAGGEPRPVAGTTGLVATTWSPGHEKWGATQANNHFQKDYKGLMQQYRPWDGQFRQPILIATDKVPVSMSPQRGFPHASHPDIEVDTLGIDEPESKCKM